VAHRNPAATACTMGYRSPISDLGWPVLARMNRTFYYFSFELIQFIPNQSQISEFHRNLFIYK
jgi:hypothetical protein